jgi:hypothetical protein
VTTPIQDFYDIDVDLPIPFMHLRRWAGAMGIIPALFTITSTRPKLLTASSKSSSRWARMVPLVCGNEWEEEATSKPGNRPSYLSRMNSAICRKLA